VLVATVLTVAGCVIPNLVELNIFAPLAPARETVEVNGRARLTVPLDDPNVLWLEIDRTRAPGTIGGFIGDLSAHRGGLAVLVNGASTLEPGGEPEATRTFYDEFGSYLRSAGFLTWSVALPECGVPYGGDDLADLIEVIDWLDAGGREYLGVQRVYVVGYSTGATLVNLLNPEREVTAIVSLAGLTSGVQLERFRSLYGLMTTVFPLSTGFCQLRSTLAAYGPPGDERWQALNVIDRLEEFRSPTLFVHGTADIVFVVENTRALEARYRDLTAAGVPLPPMEFLYLPNGSHWAGPTDPVSIERILAFLRGFEPDDAPSAPPNGAD